MFGIQFEAPFQLTAAAPTRADVVCFVGFSRRRATAVPNDLFSWLVEWGWRDAIQDSNERDAARKTDSLENVPVPIERFATFEELFELARASDDPSMTWLAASVRSFFAQGGVRCFVVRAGCSWKAQVKRSGATAEAMAAEKRRNVTRLRSLLQTNTHFIPPARSDRSQWKGVRVLHGLDEAAFVCLPDLPELVADATITVPDTHVTAEEVFVECSDEHSPPTHRANSALPMPACTEAGYRAWFAAVHAVAQFLTTERRDMQFIAAVPQPESALPNALAKQLDAARTRTGSALSGGLDSVGGIASEFIQLAWPWVVTPASESLPGRAEPADGVLAGIAARTIITQGTHRSLGRQSVNEVSGFIPVVAGDDLNLGSVDSLINRVTILGPTPGGFRVLSDQTTAIPRDARPASIRRITASVLRAARSLGESVAFEPSGPELWRDIRRQLDALMRDFFQAGALRGATPEAAFEVRCDESTMTPNDRDSGRLFALVKFAPAVPVNLIIVRLALREGGPVAT